MAKRARKASADPNGVEVMPSLVMVVDDNMVVQELNGAARAFLGSDYRRAVGKRSGEAFDCTHCQDGTGGCGSGRFCEICPIRDAATEAYRRQVVVRRRTTAELGNPGQAREVHLLVTATPLPSRGAPRILLALEDISALMALQNPAPICAYCKRVRDDEEYWEQVQVHFRRHLDLDISHGTCPACTRQFFGPLTGRRKQGPAKSPASLSEG
jgi:hypothetical protein